MGDMARIRVLVVDDHAIMRDGLRAVLGFHEDLEVVGEAQDGEEAIAQAKALSPDVVLMDIAMPGLNGIAATRAIKAECPSTRVLILSQHEDRQYLMPVLDAGASGYVLKRAPGADLVAAVRTVYQGKSYLYPSLASTVMRELRETAGWESRQEVALTPRETEILKLVARGLTNPEIAERLVLSLKTVDWHRTNLMAKIGAHSAVELTRYALRRRLVSAED
jgi:DNA-binding NarL/FixJ family response regulator